MPVNSFTFTASPPTLGAICSSARSTTASVTTSTHSKASVNKMDVSRRRFLQGTIGGAAMLGSTMQNTSQKSALQFLSISELSDLIRTRKLSPVEVTQATLERIEKFNPVLNAYITITRESALKSAQEAESEIRQNKWRGPLHGVPIAVKDLFDTAGVRTTAGSAVFKDRVPQQDAEVVRRLRAAGAVLLGKLNM